MFLCIRLGTCAVLYVEPRDLPGAIMGRVHSLIQSRATRAKGLESRELSFLEPEGFPVNDAK